MEVGIQRPSIGKYAQGLISTGPSHFQHRNELPGPAVQPTRRMPQCGRSDPPFAANAKPEVIRNFSRRTSATLVPSSAYRSKNAVCASMNLLLFMEPSVSRARAAHDFRTMRTESGFGEHQPEAYGARQLRPALSCYAMTVFERSASNLNRVS